MKLIARGAFAVLMLAIGTVANVQQRYDDWFVGVADNRSAVYAGTGNESGSLLVQYCYFGQSRCEYRIAAKSGCETGSQYPGLLNTDAGAASVTLTCDGNREAGFVYVISPFDTIDEAVRTGSRIGFAMPLTGDQFRVIRFSLRGSTAATTFMRGAFSRSEGAQTRGVRDSTL